MRIAALLRRSCVRWGGDALMGIWIEVLTVSANMGVALYKTYTLMIHSEIPKERDTDSSQVADQDQDQLKIAIEAHSL
jgi:hypothetical protein